MTNNNLQDSLIDSLKRSKGDYNNVTNVSHPFPIYVKDGYNVIERNDLNIVDNSLEAVWVEIKNEKGKNIVCGCIYRHPNSDIDDFNNYISKCLTIINTEK